MTSHASLSVENLLERARREAACDDFGTTQFLPALRKLIESLNEKREEFHDRGWQGVQDRMVRQLVNRLRMQRDIAAHPEILQQEILPPAAIIGLPRTGSTKLQRLLAAGRGFHELPMWQGYNIAPLPQPPVEGRDPRIRAAADFVQWLAMEAADGHKGHTLIAEAPEEETLILEYTFETPAYITFMPVYSWCHYIERLDKTQMYAFLRTALQYLQWQFHQGEHKSWLLKYPANMGNETFICRNFPGVRYVVTHRDPFPVMVSLSTLIAASQQLYCRPQSIAAASRWAIEEFSSEAARHLAWREANPDAQVLDVAYRDIVHNGLDVARRIYEFLEVDWSAATEREIAAWLKADESKHERLESRAEDLAYGEAEVREMFGDYCARFAAYF